MNDTFLKACRGEKTDYTPVWFMRQAGRILPDYRKLISKHGFLNICRTPELTAEVTIQPVDTLGVDAAIFFSDILTTVVPMGMNLVYNEPKGPSFTNPVRTKADADRLVVPDPEEGLKFVYDAQKILARELANRVPFIGFAGSPLTVMTFMVGSSSKNFDNMRHMIFADTPTFRIVMDKVSRFTAKYLAAQARSGASAVMLFDSFAGMLGPEDFQGYNLPYIKSIIAELKKEKVPVIYFGLGAIGSLDQIKDCGADVIGVDYGISLDKAVAQLGKKVSVQGNLEPYVLLQTPEQIEARAKDTLAKAKSARGHIFNLGHGVPSEAPMDNVKFLVDAVHRLSRR
ncbi:MAG: uroporphyrinogen decarboxylase [Dehalococcoidia bacterium]|nr:MAG: uroporphyrinogen decarboxylase [Dehalococcoidia bacterium]